MTPTQDNRKSRDYATSGSTRVARKFQFTEKKINQLPSPTNGQRAYYYDLTVRGLTCAVTPSGKKSYVLYRKVKGRPERATIGPCCDLTVDRARELAEKMNAVIAEGGNPAQERRSVREEMTLQELWDSFLTLYAKERLRPSTWKNYQSIFKVHLHGWRNRKLFEIRPTDVIALHARIGKTSGQHAANRTTEFLSAMFARAIKKWGYQGPNPATGIEAFPEHGRERFLGDTDPKEPARFFRALAAVEFWNVEFWNDFFKLCVLTGARCSNVESMAWSEINWPRSEWRIAAEDAKENEAMHVVLSAEAMEILKRRETNSKSPWVFPSPRKSKSGHVEESKAAWARILKSANITDLRVHDLRRTLGSWQMATGASLAIVGKTLGHKDGSPATKVYARLNLDPIRASVNLATRALLAAGDESHLEAEK